MTFDVLSALVFKETKVTLYMVAFSSLFAIIIGLILGIILYSTSNKLIKDSAFARGVNIVLGTIVNIGRSLPFIILIIAVLPLAQVILKTGFGSKAAIVPLTIAAIPFVARIVETTFLDLDKGVIEAAITMGASYFEIIFKVLIPETLPALVMDFTVTIINLIGYSAMAGTMGGGGLGNLAIVEGYQRFNNQVLVACILVLILIIQLIQALGSLISRKLNHR